MEKDSKAEVKVAKSLKLDKAIFDAVVEAARQDKRSVNSEIQILLTEALAHRREKTDQV